MTKNKEVGTSDYYWAECPHCGKKHLRITDGGDFFSHKCYGSYYKDRFQSSNFKTVKRSECRG